MSVNVVVWDRSVDRVLEYGRQCRGQGRRDFRTRLRGEHVPHFNLIKDCALK